MRLTPKAIVTVVTATKPSGITDTAKLKKELKFMIKIHGSTTNTQSVTQKRK